MKASLQWMNEYVPLDLNRPAQELADELTQAGIPVEEVLSMDPGLKKSILVNRRNYKTPRCR